MKRMEMRKFIIISLILSTCKSSNNHIELEAMDTYEIKRSNNFIAVKSKDGLDSNTSFEKTIDYLENENIKQRHEQKRYNSNEEDVNENFTLDHKIEAHRNEIKDSNKLNKSLPRILNYLVNAYTKTHKQVTSNNAKLIKKFINKKHGFNHKKTMNDDINTNIRFRRTIDYLDNEYTERHEQEKDNTDKLIKKDINDNFNADVVGVKINGTEEECIGDKEFCNMTREDYTAMLNDYIYPQTYEWVLIGTHTAVFIIGLVGNTLVCVAVYRNHSMRTVTNYFIVNLAVADFMVILFCLPPTVLWDVTETWFLGPALCKILLYFQSVSVTVSVLTLTFISVDRWYAICFPLKFKSTTSRAKTAILIIWTVSLLFNSPDLVVLTTVRMVPLRYELEYLVQCMATWSDTSDLVFHVIKVLFIYTIPVLLMTVAYYQIVRVLWRSDKIPGQAETVKLAPAEQTQLRSRRKAAKMLVAVVLMFAVCYFPVHLLSVLRYTLDMEQNDVITFVALLSHVMCYANSAINPLIYNFMSGKYRREFRRAFCCSSSLTHDSMTTMTRLTYSKKRPSDLSYEEHRPYYQARNTCRKTYVQNGYRNGYMT